MDLAAFAIGGFLTDSEIRTCKRDDSKTSARLSIKQGPVIMSNETQPADTRSIQNANRSWRPSFRFWRNAFVGLLLISPILIRAWLLSKVPEIRPFDVDAFCRVEIPSGQNAFDQYREAFQLGDTVLEVRNAKNFELPYENFDQVMTNGWSVADDSLRACLEDFRPALEKWRSGTDCTDAVYLMPGEINFMIFNDFENQLPAIGWSRQFARLAKCEAARLEDEGKLDEARGWYIAIFRCGCHLSRRAFSMQRMTGSALLAMSESGLVRWAEDPLVTADQLRRTLNEIQVANQMLEPVSTALKAEYICAINTFKQADWYRQVGFGSDSDVGMPIVVLGKILMWVVGEPQTTERILRQILANQLNEVDKPLPEQQPRVGLGNALLFQPDPENSRNPNQLTPDAINRAIARLVPTRLYVPRPQTVEQILLVDARDRARLATLEVAIAVQAFRREQGEFPVDPLALVPKYLDAWPVDSCDKTGKPIQYRRDSSISAVVWSIGPDDKDDGGDVLHAIKPASDIGWSLKAR
jgi:hypothetical protein